MLTLPDTSVWVDYLRDGTSKQADELELLMQAGEALTCGPVMAELLAGMEVGERAGLTNILQALPWAEIDREGWREVGLVAANLRAVGKQTALTDIEIGVAAARAKAKLWTNDRDFLRLSEFVDGLELRVD